MSDIHIYYYANHSLRLHDPLLIDDILFDRLEERPDFKTILKKKIGPKTSLSVFFDMTFLSEISVTVPESFDTEDILHFIALEQARFFPMLERDIYFDFSVLEVSNLEKSLRIFACNKKIFQSLENIFLELNIKCNKICIDHANYTHLNFLPWRQEEKKRIKNKNRQCVFFSIILTTIIMLIISFIFFCYAYKSRANYQQLFHATTKEQETLASLEKTNHVYSDLSHEWAQYSIISSQQEKLLNILVSIESSRPRDLVLKNITVNAKGIFIQGQARDSSEVKSYLTSLEEHQFMARLENIENSINSNDVMKSQFQITLMDKI